jgi:hypothetical protein
MLQLGFVLCVAWRVGCLAWDPPAIAWVLLTYGMT